MARTLDRPEPRMNVCILPHTPQNFLKLYVIHLPTILCIVRAFIQGNFEQMRRATAGSKPRFVTLAEHTPSNELVGMLRLM